jgi:low temperature requirement protein LtrA
VPRAFDETDHRLVTYGYVIMRAGPLVAQWLRAARSDPERRRTALAYAAGITLVQIGWMVRLLLPESWNVPAFLVLAVAELLVPIVAERSSMTPWHPRHIAERYGLFTLIVLGESVLWATLADAGVVIVFSIWRLYFDRPAHDLLTSLRRAFIWGYGKYLIFASLAAVGAGLAVSVDHAIHVAHVSGVTAGYTVAVPVALFLLVGWVLHVYPHQRGPVVAAYPAAAHDGGQTLIVLRWFFVGVNERFAHELVTRSPKLWIKIIESITLAVTTFTRSCASSRRPRATERHASRSSRRPVVPN